MLIWGRGALFLIGSKYAICSTYSWIPLLHSVCVEVTEMTPPIHSSAQVVREHFATPLEASLDDCLQWHTRNEKVH